MFEQGYGAWAIAGRLNVRRNTVVKWLGRYRRQGDEGLERATVPMKYSVQTKIAAVEAVLAGTVKHPQ
ncbi:hypothetical protein BIU82_13875 [Arthrobacter sp. SW1]|nr:hypothetical protein BIU82_13875 [Arthrobacter sp. SW1]